MADQMTNDPMVKADDAMMDAIISAQRHIDIVPVGETLIDSFSDDEWRALDCQAENPLVADVLGIDCHDPADSFDEVAGAA